MQKVTGEPAALVAATLAQAEMTMRAARVEPGRAGSIANRFSDTRGMVAAAYAYYLDLVTTGEVPPKPELKPGE